MGTIPNAMPTWQARRHSFSVMCSVQRFGIKEIERGVDIVVFMWSRFSCALLSARNVRI